MIADCRITNAQIRCVRIANSHEQCTNKRSTLPFASTKKGLGNFHTRMA